MKKLIKQDLTILLSLIAAYHPKAKSSIEEEARRLSKPGHYIFILRDGQCRLCPYADVFEKDGHYNLFWLGPPQDPATIRALHIYVSGIIRNSPMGSVIMPGYIPLLNTIERISKLQEIDRQNSIEAETRHSLTHSRLCSSLEFIRWLKGGDEVWT